MLTGNFSPWPSFTLEESEAVQDVLLSNKVNYWTGDECRKFESEFAAFTGCAHAIAVSNGTVALDLCLRALCISDGDEVIVTSRTFLASVSSIVNAGAIPVFADVDLNSQNITAHTIQNVISPRTRAILCVHLAGWPCDMDPILSLAQDHDLVVIEDCAQAHGAMYKGRSVGSIGDVASWSFCQDKIITTGGEGGMVTTNSSNLWSKMWSFKDHGKSWEAMYEKEHPPGFRWVHESFGTNWRMTEMQAAIGRIQLKRINKWHKVRLSNARRIWEAARQCERIRVPNFSCDECEGACSELNQCSHAAYKCYIFVNGSESDRDAIMDIINGKGIPCFSGSCSEVYLEKAFESTDLRPQKPLLNAKLLGQTSLMFLCHPTLTTAEVDRMCVAIKEATSEYWNRGTP